MQSTNVFFYFMAAVLVGNGVFALVRPRSRFFFGGSSPGRNRFSAWMMNDGQSDEISPQAVMFIRFIGCFMIVGAVGMFLAGVREQ